ncbi:MAG: type II 3-dehydroquinate dehydratase [Kiritimatiellae bacterium]|nr:type II 3-dehydroquinate dehydratase [Kiritimatiellia bacterium]
MSADKPVVLLVNGPNLDQLGKRDPAHYGSFTLADVERAFAEKCAELGVEARFFQSGCEGELCHAVHEARDYAAGIVINAGAYTHYSYALRDAIEVAKLPAVEVHISDIHSREPFRRVSVIRDVCRDQVCGLGLKSYTEGLERLVKRHILPAAKSGGGGDTAEESSSPQAVLAAARAEIDRCNLELVSTLERRFEASVRIAESKFGSGKPVYDPDREAAVIDAVRRAASEPCADAAAAAISTVMRLSRERQYDFAMARDREKARKAAGLPPRTDGNAGKGGGGVAFAGAAGSYGEKAATALFPGDRLVPVQSFADACRCVAQGETPVAVLPLANTTGGPVDMVYRLLKHDLHIVRAVDIAIKHCVAAVPGASLAGVKTVSSHPQALAQCSRAIRDNGWQTWQAGNTAFAAAQVAKAADPALAAICSPEAAKANGLEILAENVCDTGVNATRFVAVARNLAVSPDASRLSLLISLPHRTGTLASALAVFSDRGLNLSSICSQPIPERPWEYAFFIDIDAPALADNAVAAVYQRRSEPPFMRVVGWYGCERR